ncbi:hypothetical protein BG005_009731 [Podila minutissima]|nr:hypothetical protein BG005_009731 [Podila minutissima]
MSYYPGQPWKTTSQANGRQNYFPSYSDSMFDPFSFGDSTRDMIEQQHPYYKHQQEQAQRRQMAEQQQRENELRRQQLQRNQQEAALRRHLHNQQQQEAAYQKQQEGYQKQHEAALRRQQHQQQVHQQHHQSQRSKKQQEQLQHPPKVAPEKPPEHPNPQARSRDQRNQDSRPHAIFPGQSQVGLPGSTSKKAARRRARRQRQAKESGNQDPVEDIVAHSFFQPDEQKDSMNDIESLVEAAFGDGSSNHKNKSNSSRQHQQERLGPSRQHHQTQPQSQPHRQPHGQQHQRPPVKKKEESEESEEDEGEEEEEDEEEQVSTPETSSMGMSDQDDQDNIHEEEEEQEQPHPLSEKHHAELQAIEKNLDELEVELKQILAGQITKKKQILMTEEMLTKAMLKVDSIESEGDWSIRRRRKSLINRCESLLERVDGYKRQHREELRW